MALKATVFKADLQVADMDRHYYHDHALTLARHPSETDERMMVRVLAFAFHASDMLTFTRGLSSDDEPELWQKGLTGDIDLWIELGQPDEKRIRKACHRAAQVYLYCYGGRASTIWWDQLHNKVNRFENLKVINLPEPAVQVLASMAQRTMRLQCNIQDGQAWVSDQLHSVQIEPEYWKR